VIEHLLTTNLRLCQNASYRTSLRAAADMKLRYVVMLYKRAKTLAQQELDWQQNQVAGGGGSDHPKSLSTHSSQNMQTLEHAMELIHNGPDDSDFVPAARKARRLDVHKQPAALFMHPLPICLLRRPAGGLSTAFRSRLLDSLDSLPFRGCTAQTTIAKMSCQREQATSRRGRLGFHASRTGPAMRRQNSPCAEGYLERKQTGAIEKRKRTMVVAYGMRTYL